MTSIKEALEIVRCMIQGDQIESAIVDTDTMASLGDVVKAALAQLDSGYAWSGLGDDRVADKGYKPWCWSGSGQKQFQGGKEDVRDIIRTILSTGLLPDASPGNGAEKVSLPAIPDDDADFTPDLARKIIARYQQIIDALHSTSAAGETTSSDGVVEGHDKANATGLKLRSERPSSPSAIPTDYVAAGIKPGPSEAIPADVLAMKEACKRVALKHFDFYSEKHRTATMGDDKNLYGMVASEKIAAAIDKPSPEVKAADTFQSRVQPWMMACFGPEISADRIERNHRFLEEALELVQSTGCTQSEAHQLVDYVYGRPQGEVNQEVGGVMVTLAALCLANGIDMHEGGETELARVWTMVEKIRAKQAAKPKHSPLPEVKAEGGRGEPRAWIASDPEGGPYLTWSETAARNFPNPTPLYTRSASPPDVEAIAGLITDNLELDWYGREAAERTRGKVTKTARAIAALLDGGRTASAIRTGGQK